MEGKQHLCCQMVRQQGGDTCVILRWTRTCSGDSTLGQSRQKPTLTLERLPFLTSKASIYNESNKSTPTMHLFTAKHKYALKSWRWYMYIFWHTISLAVVNACLLYKQHSLCSQDAKEGDTEHEKVPSTAGFLSHYGNSTKIIYLCYLPCLW